MIAKHFVARMLVALEFFIYFGFPDRICAQQPPKPLEIESYWGKVCDLPTSCEVKASRLIGYIECRFGIEPPNWWQDRLLEEENWSQKPRSLPLSNVSVHYNREEKQLELETEKIAYGLKVDGNFDSELLGLVAVSKAEGDSIIVAYNSYEKFQISKLSKSSKVLWTLDLGTKAPYAISTSGPAPNPPMCEIQQHDNSILFYGARVFTSVIVELDNETGAVIHEATLTQIKNNGKRSGLPIHRD